MTYGRDVAAKDDGSDACFMYSCDLCTSLHHLCLCAVSLDANHIFFGDNQTTVGMKGVTDRFPMAEQTGRAWALAWLGLLFSVLAAPSPTLMRILGTY